MRLAVAMLSAAAGLSACAYDPYYAGYGPPNYAYSGNEWPRDELGGEGAYRLDPWLSETEEGREIVRSGFEAAAEGWVDPATADRINIWFRRYADTDRDLRLTDEEIRVALVQAARDHGPGFY